MKTFDMNQLLVPAPAATNETTALAAAAETNVELKQQLWQLLLPLPAAGKELGVNPAAARASTADGQSRDGERSNGLTSELVSTAYILAAQIQQFTAFALPTQTQTESAPPSEGSYTVKLESAADGGGLASVELAHPELGPVSLAIELSSGAARVTATATSERSAQVIADGQAILTERLARQGVTLEVLDVIVVPHRADRKRIRARARASRRSREET
ncbi:MAG TPA: flagellar hook-length control protein FliK [Polyangiales bacterium]|nr:flagellar hook-length control protein FliK [Polyangiales bacterium]